LQASAAAFIVGQSESLPMRIATSADGAELFFFMSLIAVLRLSFSGANLRARVTGPQAKSIPKEPSAGCEESAGEKSVVGLEFAKRLECAALRRYFSSGSAQHR
jgi:hypothetical protein